MNSTSKALSPVRNYLMKGLTIGAAALALAGCTGTTALADEPGDGPTIVSVPQDSQEYHAVSNVSQLPAQWEAAMQGMPGRVDIAVYDLRTGETAQWATPGADTFNTASIVKYSILVETLRQHQASGEPLSEYDVQQAEAMIQQSDNSAASYLWRKAGGAEAMRTFFASIGANATQLRNSWGVTLTTALDQLQVLKQLTPLGTTLTPESIALMNSILAGVTPSQHWGVSGGVPTDVPVWLKNGWLYDSATGNDYSGTSSWTVNSIGNVGDRYLIAILSEGNPVGSNRAEQHGIERLETLAGITWANLA